MNAKIVSRIYDNYARIYDLIFGEVLDSGRRKAIRMMHFEPGDDILEIGIGTGLSLKRYPVNRNIKITGIDLSEKMLNKAKRRASSLRGVKIDLIGMDGERTSFAANSFDKVVLMYVYSVTASPEALMEEVMRVCKPGGDVYIVNHFSHSKDGKLSFLESTVSSLSNIVGFRSDFSYQQYVSSLGYPLVSEISTNLFSLTKVIHIKSVNTSQMSANKPRADEAVSNI